MELRPKMSGVRQGPETTRGLVVARQRDALHFNTGVFNEKGLLAVEPDIPKTRREMAR